MSKDLNKPNCFLSLPGCLLASRVDFGVSVSISWGSRWKFWGFREARRAVARKDGFRCDGMKSGSNVIFYYILF